MLRCSISRIRDMEIGREMQMKYPISMRGYTVCRSTVANVHLSRLAYGG